MSTGEWEVKTIGKAVYCRRGTDWRHVDVDNDGDGINVDIDDPGPCGCRATAFIPDEILAKMGYVRRKEES